MVQFDKWLPKVGQRPMQLLMRLLGPCFLNTLICSLFMTICLILFVKTDFAFIVVYDSIIVCLMLLAMSLMCTFLLQMHRGLPKLERRLAIPKTTYICLLALTISVSIGYCYIFVYKAALYGCDKAVEARDLPHMVLDSAMRLSIALFALVSFVYICQRSHIGSLNTGFDFFTRNFINCVFGILWLRFLMVKGYFTIEQYCRDDINVSSVVKDFCPPYIKNGFQCRTEDLREEQRIWYRVHYGLLKSVVVTCAAELVPVLLVGHWLACGRAEKVVQKLTTRIHATSSSKELPQLESMADLCGSASESSTEREMSICSATLLLSSPWLRRTLRCLALSLGLSGVCLWMLSFFNYIHDMHYDMWTRLQDGMEVFTALGQFSFFALLFHWVHKVPDRELDLHHRAESRGDRALIFSSLTFLSLECAVEVCELLFFTSTGPRAHFEVKTMDLLFSVFSLAANWLEALALRKIVALKSEYLLQFRGILPFIVLGCTVFNFADFSMTYFYIETQKHHLTEIIESLEHNNTFVLLGVIGRILDTANYLYTFTCALCWIDVLMRYYNSGFFILGKKLPEEKKPLRNGSSHFLRIPQMYLEGEKSDGEEGII